MSKKKNQLIKKNGFTLIGAGRKQKICAQSLQNKLVKKPKRIHQIYSTEINDNRCVIVGFGRKKSFALPERAGFYYTNKKKTLITRFSNLTLTKEVKPCDQLINTISVIK